MLSGRRSQDVARVLLSTTCVFFFVFQEHGKFGEFLGWVGSVRRKTVLDSLVGTILSQNTTDVNSHRAFKNLKVLGLGRLASSGFHSCLVVGSTNSAERLCCLG